MNYSNPDMNYMRRDALRRTREMHRQNMNRNDVQAQRKPEPVMPFSAPPPETESVPPHDNTAEKKSAPKQPIPPKNYPKQQGGLNSLLSGFFNDGRPDNDKIIIIALIVILAREGADLKLLLALGYILM